MQLGTVLIRVASLITSPATNSVGDSLACCSEFSITFDARLPDIHLYNLTISIFTGTLNLALRWVPCRAVKIIWKQCSAICLIGDTSHALVISGSDPARTLIRRRSRAR